MLSLNNIKSNSGARKVKKRLGRGNGSGKGTYSGRGCKGQNARGSKMPQWFEGGQTPLFRRTPKLRGFSNHRFKTNYNVINLKDLEDLGQKGILEIDKKVLIENGYIRKKDWKIKILGQGELKTKITTLTVDKASNKAKENIEKLGGKLILEKEESKKDSK